MSAPEYVDVTAKAAHEHNMSAQKHVMPNNDPALDMSHEHHHGHLHHSTHVEQGREDDVVYSKDTTLEKSAIPHQDPQDHDLHRRHLVSETKMATEDVDAEKGALSPIRSEEDPQTHTLSTVYTKHRVFFHLFIWLLFTGSVLPSSSQPCHCFTAGSMMSAPIVCFLTPRTCNRPARAS